ncbi:MAG: 16S rRNA (cytidine(1402)-2'-O)-methyltransferase [Candidatus Ancillula sp.]|jgi:16S rRNA (cytidine1402-2'-O)-methyltransferase|nr:16S rRNA (cytidine(1402)-2'-O)-methyltransferase [Candidatus Ancillula sp.]
MLVLASTPIGNIDDSSARLKQWLLSADFIAAEDTRNTLKLAARLGLKITAEVLSVHDHNEAERLDLLLKKLQEGQNVLLVSDAGTPLINDPGFKLVQIVIQNGIQVSTLPGPSAPITALVLSGLPVHKFCYEGFLPPKSGSRINALRRLENEPRTMVFLESKHRVAKTLRDMAEVFGEARRAAVCRELTKEHEEVLRGSLGELVEVTQARELKGEMCVVVGGVGQV